MYRRLFSEKEKEYLKKHKACPKCNRTKFYLPDVWGVFTCKCGWRGKMHGLVEKQTTGSL